MKHAIQHIHFVGIGGAGMSAIAEILHQQGYRVSGSDLADSGVTRRLAALGVTVHIGHAAAHIAGAQAVVTSTAVKADNPEVSAAHAARVPVVARAVMLAELMRPKQGIAVAGTHGKTTTTGLVASVLLEAGVDPTYVIGGALRAPTPSVAATGDEGVRAATARPVAIAAAAPSHARLGAGPHIVVEADESDASFLHLSPVIGVVTNIDADHMETYGHSLPRLHDAFVEFIHRLPFYGRAVVCGDDAGVHAIVPRLERFVTTYGIGAGVDLRAVDVQPLDGGRMQFVARQAGHADLALTLNLAGDHNVRNALAALAVARELQLPDAAAARALATFGGVGRRFERHDGLPCADGGHYTLIDDYGHHPVELAAVVAAARGAFPGRRLVMVFQPHRYTRTRDCFADFVAVLGSVDAVLLTEVYAAGEAPIAGAGGSDLAQAVQRAGQVEAVFVAGMEALPAAIARAVRDGDVLITAGAGSIGGVAQQLVLSAGGAA